jgi:hypothetical protein
MAEGDNMTIIAGFLHAHLAGEFPISTPFSE